MPDMLTAIADIIQGELFDLPKVIAEKGNRQTSKGELFEIYCKDRLVGLRRGASQTERAHDHDHYLVYPGSEGNPPDAMYWGGNSGDAFEFKQSQGGHTAAVQLNSSSPKAQLRHSSHMLTQRCRDCEPWTERDLIYVFGGIPAKKKEIKWIWFVDASLMAAQSKHYDDVYHSVRSKLSEVPKLNTSDTTELGRFNQVDPLGATSLRIRAMWFMDGPGKFFERIPGVLKASRGRVLYGIMRKAKWERFAESSRKRVLDLKGTTGFSFSEVEAPDPGIAGKSLDAILIRFELPA
jgi:hypothetical protein